MTDVICIPKLNVWNHPEWAYVLKQQLVLQGLASAVDPDCSIPGDVIQSLKGSVVNVQSAQKVKTMAEVVKTSAVARAKETPEHTEQEMAIIRAVINERALSLIKGSVSFDCSYLIGSGNVSAMEAWLNLESACTAKLKGRTAALMHALQSAKLGKQTIGEFIGVIVRLGAELRAAGGTVSDQDIKAYVLGGLPASYQPVKDVLSEQEQLTVPEFQALLQHAAGRHKANLRVPSPPTATGHTQAARGVRAGSPPQKKDNVAHKAWLSKAVCRHCGVKGHLWKSCPKRLKQEAISAGMGGIVLQDANSALSR